MVLDLEPGARAEGADRPTGSSPDLASRGVCSQGVGPCPGRCVPLATLKWSHSPHPSWHLSALPRRRVRTSLPARAPSQVQTRVPLWDPEEGQRCCEGACPPDGARGPAEPWVSLAQKGIERREPRGSARSRVCVCVCVRVRACACACVCCWLEYQVTRHLIKDLLYVFFNQLPWKEILKSFKNQHFQAS